VDYDPVTCSETLEKFIAAEPKLEKISGTEVIDIMTAKELDRDLAFQIDQERNDEYNGVLTVANYEYLVKIQSADGSRDIMAFLKGPYFGAPIWFRARLKSC